MGSLVVVLLVAFLRVVPAVAQAERDTSDSARAWSVGIHAGIAWSMHTDVDIGPVDGRFVPDPGSSLTATGVDPVFSVDAAFRLGTGIWILPSISYAMWSVTYEHRGSGMYNVRSHRTDDTDSIARDTIARLVPIRATSDLQYHVLRAAILAGVKLFGNERLSLGLALGPALGLLIDPNLENRIELDPSVPGEFVNPERHIVEQQTQLIVFDDHLPGSQSIRVGLVGGAFLRYDLGEHFTLTGLGLVDVPFTTVEKSGSQWKALAVEALLGLHYRP